MFLEKTPQEKAQVFDNDILATNRGYNYYVDWRNIVGYSNYSVQIHALDALIGCDDEHFFERFKETLTLLPSVISIIPYLFALAKQERTKVIKEDYLKIIRNGLGGNDYDLINFNPSHYPNGLSDDDIQMYYDCFTQMGLKHLFQDLLESSVQDYIVGTLVGLDSNGRKNRGGQAFELACEPLIRMICSERNLVVVTQKNFDTVAARYGINVVEQMKKRKADFIIVEPDTHKCLNIEVNFFNGGGSKPEEIINSYSDRLRRLNSTNISFALITDGNCWKGTTNQLKVGFESIPYLMNYRMARGGMLKEVIDAVFRE